MFKNDKDFSFNFFNLFNLKAGHSKVEFFASETASPVISNSSIKGRTDCSAKSKLLRFTSLILNFLREVNFREGKDLIFSLPSKMRVYILSKLDLLKLETSINPQLDKSMKTSSASSSSGKTLILPALFKFIRLTYVILFLNISDKLSI